MTPSPKYPHVNVHMKEIETRGVLSAMASIKAALGKVSRFEIEMFRQDMREAKDLDEAVTICKRWFVVIPSSPSSSGVRTTP